MSLVNKLKNTGKALALAGILANPGCMLPAAAFIHGVAINSAAEKEAEGRRDAARIASQNNGEIVLDNGTASRFKDNTIYGELYVVSCNYFKDLDGNGLTQNEFFGIKSTFGKNEKINLFFACSEREFDELNYELLNSRGNIVEKFSLRNINRTWASYNSSEEELKKMFSDGKLPEGMVNNLSSGDYRAVFSSGNKAIAVLDFSVR